MGPRVHRLRPALRLRSQLGFLWRALQEERALDRRYSRPVPLESDLLSDHTVVLRHYASARVYPDDLRRVRFHDAEADQRMVFLSNNFGLALLTIAHLYKARWKVGTVLQMDQAASAHQGLLRHQRNAVKT